MSIFSNSSLQNKKDLRKSIASIFQPLDLQTAIFIEPFDVTTKELEDEDYKRPTYEESQPSRLSIKEEIAAPILVNSQPRQSSYPPSETRERLYKWSFSTPLTSMELAINQAVMNYRKKVLITVERKGFLDLKVETKLVQALLPEREVADHGMLIDNVSSLNAKASVRCQQTGSRRFLCFGLETMSCVCIGWSRQEIRHAYLPHCLNPKRAFQSNITKEKRQGCTNAYEPIMGSRTTATD